MNSTSGGPAVQTPAHVVEQLRSWQEKEKLDILNTKFVAVSGFLYVTHFIHWLVGKTDGDLGYAKKYPNPTLVS